MGVLDTLKSTLGRTFFPDSDSGRKGRIDRHWKAAIKKHRQGQYLDSEQEFSRAIAVAEEYGHRSLRLAGHLDRLADFYHSVGKYAEAEKLFRQVLGIKEQRFGLNAVELAPAINNLALLHYAQGRYSKGEPLYQRLLELLEKNRGKEDREVAICLENYAALLRKMQRDEEAGRLQSRAADIRRRLKALKADS